MKALIVIDMQNDFIDGSLGTPEAVAIVPVVKKLIDEGDYHRLIFTRDTHENNYLLTQEGQNLPGKFMMTLILPWQMQLLTNHHLAGQVGIFSIINGPIGILSLMEWMKLSSLDSAPTSAS